jgi:hypothetical protein
MSGLTAVDCQSDPAVVLPLLPLTKAFSQAILAARLSTSSAWPLTVVWSEGTGHARSAWPVR